MEEIKSLMESISEIFLNKSNTFHIPDFQRDFIWTRKEVEELMDDFFEDTNGFTIDSSELQGYLLGNIVLIEKGKNKYLVVDGQQRITTLTLLFKVLYQRIRKILDGEIDVNKKEKWYRRLGELNKGYEITDDSDEFKSLRVTHDESLPFGKYYKSIIRDEANQETTTSSDENIAEVYDTLFEKLDELSEEQLSKFIPYIKNTVKLIVTTSTSEGKAFQLFEVLNDRGRSLEPMDLIKNNFLKILSKEGFKEEEVKSFNSDWSEFIKNLNLSPKRKISSSTFMKHFIVSEYGQNIKQDQLFNFFTKKKGSFGVELSGREIIKLADKLKRVSKIYKSIEKDPFNNDYLKKDKNMFILFKILSIRQLHPILMRFYDSDISEREKVVDACVRYGASVVFALIQTNAIEKEIPNIINKMKSSNNEVETFVGEVNKLVSSNTDQLETILTTKNFINANGKPIKKSLDILKFLELYYCSNVLIILPKKTITLEHILANKTPISDYSEYEFKDREEYDRYLNKIGNLTILYKDDNTSVGTNDISTKKNNYEQSDFAITRTIVKKEITTIKNGQETRRVEDINNYLKQYNTNDKWTKSQIDKRSADIAKLLTHCIIN